jgi:hypothetical protein
MKCDTFRRAVEAFDLDATVATFSPSIVLRSPVRDEPLEGREAVGGLFAIPFRVFEDLRLVGTYTSSDGAEVLHFLWRLGDKEGEGVDMLRFDEDGIHAQEEPRPAVVDASAGVDVTFTEIGPPELKGISGVRLHAAHRAEAR